MATRDVEERVVSTAGYQTFSAKRERHTDVHTGTDPSELHYVWCSDLEHTLLSFFHALDSENVIAGHHLLAGFGRPIMIGDHAS